MSMRPFYIKSLLLSAAVATVSACAVAPGYTEKEQSVVDSLEMGRYQPASRMERDNIETQELLAQATFWSNEYMLNPGDLESAIKLASSVRRLGNPGQAVQIAQTSRALYPRDPYLLAEFAAALIASERGDEALQPIQDGLSIAPQYARLWSLMGAALDQGEQYDQAKNFYKRALSITPNDPSILANLGLSYALQGNPQEAEVWLRRASAMPGAGKGVAQNLALVLELQGKTQSAPPQAQRSVNAVTGLAENPSSYGPAQHPGWPQPRAAQTAQPPQQNFQQPQGNPSFAAPTARPTIRGPYGAPNNTQFNAQPHAAPQSSFNYNISNSPSAASNPNMMPNGRPMTASDYARAAAARSAGRTAIVPEGAPAPTRSVLDDIKASVGPRSAMQNMPTESDAPAQQLLGYGQPQQQYQQPQDTYQFGNTQGPQIPQRREPARRR